MAEGEANDSCVSCLADASMFWGSSGKAGLIGLMLHMFLAGMKQHYFGKILSLV